MISNRQGGRRRGRGGGGRAPNISPGAGNRQDNRQRGNAAQLLEKYKGLARDAQMQGDRVQGEYFHQFADHYYRILNESRARYEEQRRQRGESGYDNEDEEQDESEAAEREAADEGEAREGDGRRDQRRSGNGEDRARRARARRPGTEADEDGDGDGERIAADSLPPAISAGGEEADEPRAPRRRPRRPRDTGDEIAPAA